jgi:hypothetical protein
MKQKGRGPNYFDKEPTTKISKKHEKDIAEKFGGTRVPGSGSFSGLPGDVKDNVFLHECKATDGGGTRIAAKWLKNISQQALDLGRIPLLELHFADQQEPASKDWVMLPVMDFLSLLEKIPGLDLPNLKQNG